MASAGVACRDCRYSYVDKDHGQYMCRCELIAGHYCAWRGIYYPRTPIRDIRCDRLNTGHCAFWEIKNG